MDGLVCRECSKIVKKAKAKLLGFACIIDRSDKKSLLIKNNKIISQIKIHIPTYKKKNLPPFSKINNLIGFLWLFQVIHSTLNKEIH